MRFLGIDYGKKRIGLAISDEAGGFAFPYQVLVNQGAVTEEIAAICTKEEVEEVIIGQSQTLSGRDNPIMKDIKQFITALSQKSNLPIKLEPELFSSAAAERVIGKDADHDARAAAIILQTYLDRQK